MLKVVLIIHNVRSAHNIGSVLRSADGFGADKVYLTGFTPYPSGQNDKRLPHIAKRASSKIAKTALGAEASVKWEHHPDINSLLQRLKRQGFTIAALEQTNSSVNLADFRPQQPTALVAGSEIGGIEEAVVKNTDVQLAIPMLGTKESFNVSVAAAVALYHLRWYNQNSDDRQNKNGFA